MYSPKVSEDLVKRLYVQGRRLGQPMTRLVNEAVSRYLGELEKEERGVKPANSDKEVYADDPNQSERSERGCQPGSAG